MKRVKIKTRKTRKAKRKPQGQLVPNGPAVLKLITLESAARQHEKRIVELERLVKWQRERLEHVTYLRDNEERTLDCIRVQLGNTATMLIKFLPVIHALERIAAVAEAMQRLTVAADQITHAIETIATPQPR